MFPIFQAVKSRLFFAVVVVGLFCVSFCFRGVEWCF